jgi:hypothetical protein
MNAQEKLSDLDRVSMMLLNVQGENATLRQKVADLESRLFSAQLQARYGNPGEQIRVEVDGTILRLPPELGKPLASVPEEASGP